MKSTMTFLRNAATALTALALLMLHPAPVAAQTPAKVTIVVFGFPSLGAFMPPVIKAKMLDTANGLGRITDAAVAVARLISAGHVAKYKNVKFFAPMGAAALPFVLGRLKRNAAITPNVADPVEALARIYTDTILHDARVLKFVVEMMGSDRLMMGSDMPFPIGDPEPTKIVAGAGLTPAQVAAINGGLAARVFNIQ